MTAAMFAGCAFERAEWVGAPAVFQVLQERLPDAALGAATRAHGDTDSADGSAPAARQAQCEVEVRSRSVFVSVELSSDVCRWPVA
jgi:hypothetical protein